MGSEAELLSEISMAGNELLPWTPLSGYNIFGVLGIYAKEVIMCRFLADLLNPEGKHGCGILFLKSFVQDVLKEYSMSDVLLAHTDVSKEFAIDKERRIDIVIQNSRFFIPIEVKIYAEEQEGQCYDYYEYARNSQIVYLTRFGDAPSEYSRKKKGGKDVLPLDRVQCISWAHDICGWLEKLIMQTDAPIRLIVMQYIDAIHMTADESDKKIMEKNLRLLYKSPDYFRAGIEIEQSMKKAKVTLMRLMFDDFKEEMERISTKYGLVPENEFHYYTYEEQCTERFYDGNVTTYPGLNYLVKKAEFYPDNIQMWFRIEVQDNLFAGITLFDTKAEIKDGISKGYEVEKITEEMAKQAAKYIDSDIITPVDWWLTWCYSNGKRQDAYYDDVPDFRNMNACAVALVDRENRKSFVKNAVGYFEEHILKYLRNVSY